MVLKFSGSGFAGTSALIFLLAADGFASSSSFPTHYYIESGSGHGGTLEFYHIRFQGRRSALISKSHINTGGFARLPDNSAWPNDSFNSGYASYDLEGNEVDSLEVAIQRAMRFPDPEPISNGGSFSSADFLASIRYRYGSKQSEKSFCGYAGSDSSFYSPIKAVIRKLETMLALEKPIGTVSDTEMAESFPEALEYALSKNGDLGWWWVIERSMLLFGVKGNQASVPILLGYLQRNRNNTKGRDIYNLITALDNMTGKNIRFVNGKPKSLDAAVSDYLDWYKTRF